MSISRSLNVIFDGLIWAAFQEFCFRKGVENSREGVRALIRDTVEFQRMEAAFKASATPAKDKDTVSNVTG